MCEQKQTSFTHIQVTKETRARLAAIGAKGETYDEIINRLLDARGRNDG